MRKLREWRRRLLFYLRKSRFDRELEAEMRFHLDMQAQDKIDRGMEARDASSASRRQFGNVTWLHERSREMWAIRWIETAGQDLRFSARMMRRNPGLVIVVTLSLGLAIGANTAIFSLIDAVLLKTLPVRNPNELAYFGWASGPHPMIDAHSGSGRGDASGNRTGTSLTYLEFERMRDQNQTLTDLFCFAPIYDQLNVSVDYQASIASGQFVSGAYYKGLGVHATLGRTLADDDDSDGASPVAVIAHRYWRTRFASDPAVVGKTAFINGIPFTIVGVSAEGFEGALDIGQSADVTVPLATEPLINRHPARDAEPGVWWLRVMGRLRPRVSLEQARANLEPIFESSALEGHLAYLSQHKGRDKGEASMPTLTAVSGSQGACFNRQDYNSQLLLLSITVLLVLLIACINTANLLLARSGARQKEVAVRIALGAGRARLLRQFLTESLTLALIGGVAGFFLAYWIKNLLVMAAPWGGEALQISLSLDFRVLAFTALVSIATGLLFGIAPALKATRIDPGPALKASSANQSQGRTGSAWGKALVLAQVALSLLLLSGAGLFIRTLRNLQRVDYGFDAANLLLFDVNPSLNGYRGENLASAYQQIAERVGALPGVRAASNSLYPLLKGYEWSSEGLNILGAKEQPDQHAQAYLLSVKDNFLDTMKIPIMLGRDLDATDLANSRRVAVVSQTFARLAFGDEDPIGRVFKFNEYDALGEMEIVGVARDTKYDSLKAAAPAIAYMPYAQHIDMPAGEGMTFEVRAAGDPMALTPSIREAVQSVDSNLAIFNIKTQTQQIEESFANERLFAAFTGALGGLALLLACLGLYGVMSYNVSRRTNEIGIRMALGAGSGRVLAQVMRETTVLVAIGAAVGAGAAIVASRVISSADFGLTAASATRPGLLFNVAPGDPATIAAAALILLLVAAIAGFVPARRASLVDPLVALRCE